MIVGDAHVMLDPYTGQRGPALSRALRRPEASALNPLDALSSLGADVALTGHGPAWKGSMSDAVQRATAAGPA